MKHLKLPLPQGQHKATNDRTGSVLWDAKEHLQIRANTALRH